MAARREALTPECRRDWSAALSGHLIAALPAHRLGIVGHCWPIRNEPDLAVALDHWRARGSLTALPVVVAPGEPLAFRTWSPVESLVPDRYGIPTPAAGVECQPTLVLLPLNAFDADGYRLGYGGGFFDRTLATLDPRPLAVGVGFECNRVASIRPQAHDQRLDWIVTEAGAWRVSPG